MALVALAVQAQNTNLTFIPGKLAVYRGGDGVFTFSDRRFPTFIDEYDPVITNQTSPMLTVALPTNGVNSMWFNLHAGSEGQGITRSADRQFIAVTGYHGDLTNVTATPSSSSDCTRGFGLVDAFTNFNVAYQSQEWFGLLPGITQDNPRGIATDGTNDFWGCGTVAGTATGSFSESGTLFWNGNIYADPVVFQNYVESGYDLKIINGVLYMLCKNEAGGALNNGIYDFVNFSFNGGGLVPLPWAPGNVQDIITTNLFLDFGTVNGAAVQNVLAFDMNTSNTIVYAADNKLGIVKYVNNLGVWSSSYIFGPTNLGTSAQKAANQGCFGVAVDFSGTNPVIYATTMESADSAGDVCSNRLICIVDAGDPGTNLVAQTLAAANGPNEGFRGLDFTPDLRPLITSEPVDVSTTTNVTASFSVAANSVYPLSYRWQENGTNVTNNSNITGANTNILTFLHSSLTNQGSYSVIITNQYGAVTSSVAVLTVSAITVPPADTNAVQHLTNYIGDNLNIAGNPTGGTPPFIFQWYFGNTRLTDGPNGSGSGYIGSTNSTLSITNVQLSDAGSYSVGATNSAGGISNLVAVLTVQYRPPTIPSGGQPVSLVMLQGQTNSLSVSSISGTPPLSYQWYQGNTNPVAHLTDANEFSGSATSTLTISGATVADATNYFCVITNLGGSITSQVASVIVIIPPAPSYVGYSNQVYTQNFDSLPNPGLTTVNTVGGGGPVTIGGVTYSLSNPFDFAFPVYFPSGNVDGLGLSTTMSGWYGECDGDTTGAQLGASWGDQTTGGIISFGLTNSLALSTNRALGLIATSTSGGTHFGLKLINQTTHNLNYISLQFVGEYWKKGTKPKTLAFGYTIDSAGVNSPFLAGGVIAQATNNPVNSLSFSFPVASAVGPTNGTLAVNQTNLGAAYLPLTTSWTPGSALWLVWSINDPTGSGQGYGIDNLSFYATSTNLPAAITVPTLAGMTFTGGVGSQFSFSNVPGASADFTVWGTTNLGLPFGQWQNLGHPTEVLFGNYQFNDSQATGKPQQFYRVTSP